MKVYKICFVHDWIESTFCQYELLSLKVQALFLLCGLRAGNFHRPFPTDTHSPSAKKTRPAIHFENGANVITQRPETYVNNTEELMHFAIIR